MLHICTNKICCLLHFRSGVRGALLPALIQGHRWGGCPSRQFWEPRVSFQRDLSILPARRKKKHCYCFRVVKGRAWNRWHSGNALPPPPAPPHFSTKARLAGREMAPLCHVPLFWRGWGRACALGLRSVPGPGPRRPLPSLRSSAGGVGRALGWLRASGLLCDPARARSRVRRRWAAGRGRGPRGPRLGGEGSGREERSPAGPAEDPRRQAAVGPHGWARGSGLCPLPARSCRLSLTGAASLREKTL